MRRSTILGIAAAACVIALCAWAARTILRSLRPAFGYADAEQYSVGGAVLDDAVANLDIHWTDGSVTLAYHPQNTVVIAESAPAALSGDAQLRWRLDGDTLRIQYAKSGFFAVRSLNKALTVTLPEGAVLGNVSVDATSADVSMPEAQAQNVAVKLTSGDLDLALKGRQDGVVLTSTSGDLHAALEDAKSVSADTASGAIRVALTGAAEAVTLSSSSGSIGVGLGSAKALSASSTSGAIRAEADALEKAGFDSTSGDISVRCTDFNDLTIEATSGNVAAALPTKPGFQARIETTSGSVNSDIALRRDGSRYACGDESARLIIHTTSGDVRLVEIGG